MDLWLLHEGFALASTSDQRPAHVEALGARVAVRGPEADRGHQPVKTSAMRAANGVGLAARAGDSSLKPYPVRQV
jgi:hypothetical protein